jgi:formylglycine-generating enzyme required for sulfatase activity
MMKQQLQYCFRWIALLLVPVLIGTGCVSAQTTETPETPRADLTALEIIVERVRDGTPFALQKDKSIDIQANDQISVKEQGRGLLTFPDRLVIELFNHTNGFVSEARLEPAGFIFVRFKLSVGHTRTELKSIAYARIRLETDYATIKTLESNTEFLACQTRELTCIVTLAGETEVEAGGRIVTVRAGEATYILPGQPPQPPICANLEEVNRWLGSKRGTAEIDPLGELVIGWSQVPCWIAPLSPATALPVTPLPPTATALPVTPLPPTATALPVTPLPPRDGMVRIEDGLYKVGSSKPDDFHTAAKEIRVAAFWIDKYEVTNAHYKEFLGATGHPQPPNWSGGTFPSGREDHPVKGVTWDLASAYCNWANKRLPTEAEWEVAARGPGPEPPLYPWGPNSQAGGDVNQLPLIDTYEVGTMPFNKSAFDVYDMAGNVWEWVGEPYAPVPDGYKVLRGGRHGFLRDMTYRQFAEPNDKRFLPFTGFRCAANRVAEE